MNDKLRKIISEAILYHRDCIFNRSDVVEATNNATSLFEKLMNADPKLKKMIEGDAEEDADIDIDALRARKEQEVTYGI